MAIAQLGQYDKTDVVGPVAFVGTILLLLLLTKTIISISTTTTTTTFQWEGRGLVLLFVMALGGPFGGTTQGDRCGETNTNQRFCGVHARRCAPDSRQ